MAGRGESEPTLTLGIDLASQPADTAICILAWRGGGPTILRLHRGRDEDGAEFRDKRLSTIASGLFGDFDGPITKVGIDDPFGWPVPFLDAMERYRHAPRWPTAIDEPRDEFRLRETDREVHRRSGKWPLPVASDRIAIPAMRTATLLTDIARHRGDDAVARDGSGLCCEVYPDPALRLWTGADGHLGYKGPERAARRAELLAALLAQLTVDDPDDRLVRVELEDDYLDALVCALVARAAELQLTYGPEGRRQADLAAVEGWIHLPTGSLGELRLAGGGS